MELVEETRMEVWQDVLRLERELHELNEQRRIVLEEIALKMSIVCA